MAAEQDMRAVYVPLAQQSSPWVTTVVARGQRVDGEYIAELREAVSGSAATVNVSRASSASETIRGLSFPRRLGVGIVTVVAFLAFGLAAAGLFAVVAVSASLREREFAIRVALGAARPAVLWEVVKGATAVVGVGLVAGGVVGAIGIVMMRRKLSLDVEVDVLGLSSAIVVAAGVVALASVGPVVRAWSHRPATLLRSN
jgi:putative ABC transport system permease protein